MATPDIPPDSRMHQDYDPIDRGSRPVPDPTVLTTELIDRAISSLMQYIDGQLKVRDERLEGIDKATSLRWPAIERIPEQIEKAIGHSRDLTDVRFSSIDQQFAERDTRSEREARDNKLAVDAAFAAQEKQAKAQNESNEKAISKSELATAETIKTLSDLFESRTNAISEKVDDLKERVGRIESRGVGQQEQKVEQAQARVETATSRRDNSGMLFAIIGTIVSISVLASAIIVAVAAP